MAYNKESGNKLKRHAAKISIISNTGLTLSKIFTGILTGSVGLLSDGIHSGLDILTSSISYLSIKKASHPPDKDHPFGHGKYEDASGLFESLFCFGAGVLILWEAISQGIDEKSSLTYDYLYIGVIIMVISSITNIFVSKYLEKVGKKTNSIALMSDAWHLKTDVLSSIGVGISLIIVYFTHIDWIDLIIAGIIAIILIIKSIDLIKKCFGELMDKSLDDDDINKVIEILEECKSLYIDYHTLKTRKAGSDKFIEVHLIVPSTQTISQAQEIKTQIEYKILSKIPQTSLTIHFEPCNKKM